MPYAPSWTVVPLVDPPVLKGMVILCALRYFVRRGARLPLCRIAPRCDDNEEVGRVGRDEDARWRERMEGVEIRDAEAIVDGPAAAALLNVRRPKEAVSEKSIGAGCLFRSRIRRWPNAVMVSRSQKG